jgi:hypothetical protein
MTHVQARVPVAATPLILFPFAMVAGGLSQLGFAYWLIVHAAITAPATGPPAKPASTSPSSSP